MAMYYYANKLNEASGSSGRCSLRMPPQAIPVPAPVVPAPVVPAPVVPAPVLSASVVPPQEQAPIVADPALLGAGTALAYYDMYGNPRYPSVHFHHQGTSRETDDYYSLARGNKYMTENACQHVVMSGGFIPTQMPPKVDAAKVHPPVVAPRTLATYPYVTCGAEIPEIEYRDGQIVTGTLDALVDMLRPGANKCYKFTFFLCSRLVIKPHELLAKICKKHFKNYDRLQPEAGEEEIIRSEIEDMRALVTLLTEWTIMLPYDFRDDRVMAIVRMISERCSSNYMAEIRMEMSATLEKLLDKVTALEIYEDTIGDVPQMSSVEHLAPGDILTLGLSPTELARQLTMVELHRMSYVGPEEFVQSFAPHSASPAVPSTSKAAIKFHHVESKGTRNLEAYADWFNRLSYLVATDILKSPKSKYRARVIEQWVMTARECFNVGNFNSLMAIISALNMASVTRLKKTWGRTSTVCGQQLRQLELCVEPAGNHARYRAALAAAPTDTAVPLLSVTCRDLHFANQGAPSRLGGNRINFEKWTVLARHVDSQLASRRLTVAGLPATPSGPRHNTAWKFLNDRPTLNENALELTSFEREPPSEPLDKERFKRLRMAS